MIKELSVFFPVYNEGLNLEKVVLSAIDILEKSVDDWEIIIVNDGSTDNSLSIARKISQSQPRVKIVDHTINRGYGAAFRSGAYAAAKSWIAFTDADGQFDFSEIKNFIQVQEQTGADLVIGYYLKRRVSVYRKINTFLWETLVRILFGLKVKDIDCAFKLFSKEVLQTIEPLASERGAFVSTEFLVKAKQKNFKIVELGIHHLPRQAGRGTGANLNVVVKSFVDLFKLWRRLR